MKFAIDDTGAGYKITAYDNNNISINGKVFDYPILVASHRLASDLSSINSRNIQPDDYQKVIDLKPQILIIGCGKEMHFLAAEQRVNLQQAGIGVEVMTTSAACRTYNVLLSEGRDAVALLFANN